MGQFLIVQGADAGAAARVYQRSLALFDSLCAIQPCDVWSGSTMIAARFPRLHAVSAGIVRDPAASTWICGAGVFFDEGRTGAEALRGLAGKLAAGPREGAFAGLDGSFALAHGDDRSGELLVVTDRLATLHVYTAQVDSCLVVCTSSMVLAALAGAPWDPVGCREFLATGTVFEARTLFQGIEKLQPASCYRFQRGVQRLRSKYWELADVMYDRSPVRGDVPQLAGALEEAMRVIAGSFRRPAFDLTGGFDSRAVFGAMLRAGAPFSTVVNGNEGNPDVTVARAIAREYGVPLRHHARPPLSPEQHLRGIKASLPLCDGEYDLLLYAPVLEVHSRLAGEFDASVNGSNGEICKGYWWELLAPFTGQKGHFDHRRIAAKRFVFEGEESGLLAARADDSLVDHFAGVVQRAGVPMAGLPNTALMDNVYLTLRMQRWQGRIASASARIWPCCCPFTFRKVMEIALATTPRARLRHRMSRHLIEHLDPRLAAIPLAQGYPALPLRPGTIHHFGPLAAEIAGKVADRLRRRLPGSAAPFTPPAYTGWLSHDEFRDLAQFPASAGLYSPEKLHDVMERIGRGTFPQQRFGRMLTLELLARAVRGR